MRHPKQRVKVQQIPIHPTRNPRLRDEPKPGIRPATRALPQFSPSLGTNDAAEKVMRRSRWTSMAARETAAAMFTSARGRRVAARRMIRPDSRATSACPGTISAARPSQSAMICHNRGKATASSRSRPAISARHTLFSAAQPQPNDRSEINALLPCSALRRATLNGATSLPWEETSGISGRIAFHEVTQLGPDSGVNCCRLLRRRKETSEIL